jgi:hypothetical protein
VDFDSPEPDGFLVDSPDFELRAADSPDFESPESDDVDFDPLDVESPESDDVDFDPLDVDSPWADPRDVESPEADSPDADPPAVDSPPFAWSAAAFFAGAPVERRSFLAQPLPLKTIVGGANSRVTGPAQSGHWWGPASLRPRKTSKRWWQELQT